MSESRRSDTLGNIEPKDLRRYFGKTVRPCPTCMKQYYYIKTELPDCTVLECPNCDQVLTVPKGTANLP